MIKILQKFFPIFIVLAFLSCSPKSTQKVTKITSNPDSKILKVDILGNVYITSLYTLDRYEFSPFDNKEVSYSENKYGDISSIDASNPFQILIWFKDFQVIQILDKNLTLLQEIPLQNLGLNISTVALSGNNLIWIFDTFQHKLLKINTQKKIVFESNPINYNEKPISPKTMIEHKGFLYLLDNEILQFDNFAKQMSVFNAQNVDDFHFYKESIILHGDLGYSKMNMNTGAIIGLNYSNELIYFGNKYLYHLKEDVLTRKKIE